MYQVILYFGARLLWYLTRFLLTPIGWVGIIVYLVQAAYHSGRDYAESYVINMNELDGDSNESE